ncbi:MAG: GtrA family protein [Pirellulales bacterium]
MSLEVPAAPANPTLVVESANSAFSRLFRQFLRYCLVGGLAFVVDLGTLALLYRAFGVDVRIAAALGFLLGLIVNYAISVAWVFDRRNVSNRWLEFAIFMVVGLLGLFVNDQIIAFCSLFLEEHKDLAKIPAAAVVLVLNFGLRKLLLFQSRD